MVHSPQSTEARDVEELLARSAVYRGLSLLLRYPDEMTVQWLAGGEDRRLLELVERSTGEASEALQDAAKRLVPLLDAASLEAWRRDYERLFGHAVQSNSPPYELEYGEPHSHRQPQELGDIAAFYTAFGLRVDPASHERADCIITECEFLHCLLYKQACALDADESEHAAVCEAAAARFLGEHLGRWAPAFARRLSRAAGPGLLAAVADVTVQWVTQECARLGVPAGPPDFPLRLPQEQDAAGEAACASCPVGDRRMGC